jgi:hypothetical protein
MAQALHLLQQSLGDISHIFYKGELSKTVWKTLTHLNAEMPPRPKLKKERIDCMILLDRKVDLFSPLCTPWTYEALLEDLLGYQDGMVQIDANIVDGSSSMSSSKDAHMVHFSVS